MKLGWEKKEERWKVYVLGALGIGAMYFFYTNVLADSSGGPSAAVSNVGANAAAKSTPAGDAAPTPSLTGGNSPAAPQRRGTTARGSEFRPKIPGSRAEERIDPAKMDPTLRLDLLARVQSVPLDGGARNIFQFGAAAPVVPTGPIPKVPPLGLTPITPVNRPPVAPGPPPQLPPPPIPFKYYGYSSVKGEPRKRAFFLDGEDIIVAWEGELLKSRYRVIKIGLTSVEVEDTQLNNRQSLPLAEDIVG